MINPFEARKYHLATNSELHQEMLYALKYIYITNLPKGWV